MDYLEAWKSFSDICGMLIAAFLMYCLWRDITLPKIFLWVVGVGIFATNLSQLINRIFGS